MLLIVPCFVLLWQNCPQVPLQEATFAVKSVLSSGSGSFPHKAHESGDAGAY